MATQSFDALMTRLDNTPEGQAAHLAVAFLAQVNAQMQAQGMNNAELARRMGTSAAYATKLFRGNANLSLQTMAKLAEVVDCKVHLHLATPEKAPIKAKKRVVKSKSVKA